MNALQLSKFLKKNSDKQLKEMPIFMRIAPKKSGVNIKEIKATKSTYGFFGKPCSCIIFEFDN